MNPIHYQITPININSHLFSVSMSFEANIDQMYTLSLPAWLPGSYMIRDFSKNIIDISCKGQNNTDVHLHRVDKQTWQVCATSKKMTISYQVFAFDLSVRTAYLDTQRGFFNGSSTFLSVDELSSSPCYVAINPCESKPNWRVATGLTRCDSTDVYQFGEYYADNYQQLIDSPVALGDFDVTEFSVAGIPHYLVFTSEHFGDRERMVSDISKLCQHHIDLFKEAPFDEYWFITHLQAKGFGGLEHKNSTILQAGRFDLPNPQKPNELTDSYKTFLSLCSHEYFHAWNVCRLKPKEFVPYDLSQEIYTEQLWAYEGITSYYDDFSLVRTGIISFEEYLVMLSKTATRVYRGPGENKQSIVESSFYTWTKFYQQGPEAANHIVSYYTKGSLFALWLDLTIREKTSGTASLDNLMQAMWSEFGRDESGTTTQNYLDIFNELCQQDLSEQFYQRLNAKESYELSEILERFGVKFSNAKFEKFNSLDTAVTDEPRPYIGALFQSVPSGLKVSSVIEDSPSANAGLAVNDILVAVNEMKITEQSLTKLLNHMALPITLNCHYFRDDKLLQAEITVVDSPLAGVKLSAVESAKSLKWLTIT